MIGFNKHNHRNKSIAYSYICIYIIILVAAIYYKIIGNDYIVSELISETLYLSLLFSLIGILFIPKNHIVWINIWVPIILNIPFLLSLIAVTHGDIIEIASYYLESIINAPIRVMSFLFNIN